MIDREKLRGKPLDDDCKRAHRTSHEYGIKDDRVFCYGLYSDFGNLEIAEKCLECGAFVDNAMPMPSPYVDGTERKE